MTVSSAEQCIEQLKASGQFRWNDDDCPGVFDGILCWPATSNGVVHTMLCPDLKGLDPSKSVSKLCDLDGKWHDPKNSGKEYGYTDYMGQCLYTEEDTNGRMQSHEEIINNIKIGQIVMTGFKLLALILFIAALVVCSLRKNRRYLGEKLRMQTCGAFILFLVLSLLLFVISRTATEEAHLMTSIEVLMQFFFLAGLSFIVMEAAVLVEAAKGSSLIPDRFKLLVFSVLGWAIPLIAVLLEVIIDSATSVCGRHVFLLKFSMTIILGIVGIALLVTASCISSGKQSRKGFIPPALSLGCLIAGVLADVGMSLHSFGSGNRTQKIATIIIKIILSGLAYLIIPTSFIAIRATRTKGEEYEKA